MSCGRSDDEGTWYSAGLTLELTGPTRHAAWPVRPMMTDAAARAKPHAVAGPVERPVRHRAASGCRSVRRGWNQELRSVCVGRQHPISKRQDGCPHGASGVQRWRLSRKLRRTRFVAACSAAARPPDSCVYA